MPTCLPAGHAPLKKTPPPIPLWSPFASTSVSAGLDPLERHGDYVSVLRNRAGAKLSSLFMWSAWALGSGSARRVPLGWQTAWVEALAVILEPTPCDGSGATRWRG